MNQPEPLFHSVHFRLALLLISNHLREFLDKHPDDKAIVAYFELHKEGNPEAIGEYTKAYAHRAPTHGHEHHHNNADKNDYPRLLEALIRNPLGIGHTDEVQKDIMTYEKAKALHAEVHFCHLHLAKTYNVCIVS